MQNGSTMDPTGEHSELNVAEGEHWWCNVPLHTVLVVGHKNPSAFHLQLQCRVFLNLLGEVNEKHIQEEHSDDRREGEVCEEAKEENSIVTKLKTQKPSSTSYVFGYFEVLL